MTTPVFTREEVKTRSGADGGPVWIIVKDVVYDVTKYVYEHPGGTETIMKVAGEDATRDFQDVGHSIDAKSILSNLKIGEIVEEEKYYDANGKKKKRKVVAATEDKETRSCISIISCGLIG